jgi:two-component system heavy metal sensor histidine kinase CusS
MTPISTDRRLSLLWRTILLLTVFVMITQIFLYIWIQRSVRGHFEQMDTETLTHAAFNLRQRMMDSEIARQTTIKPTEQNLANQTFNNQTLNNQPSASVSLDYEVKTVIAHNDGQIISSSPTDFINSVADRELLNSLWQRQLEQSFDLQLDKRHYRAIVIKHAEYLALIALPIDVHHQYLIQFNRQLILILIAITLLLVSIAAFSVHLGFAPLATFSYKMQRINAEQLNDRISVSEMPSELRPLASAYNAMMDQLEHNFDSLSRFSDDIAHELRTPLATLSTQTQVMLSQPRDNSEYVEQLHHQHATLEQLSTLINSMLLLAKTQKGLLDSQFNAVNSETLITKLMSYYELIAEDRGITLQKSGEFIAVLGDSSLLQRLFANLLSNAIYYAASDSSILIQASIVAENIINDAQKFKQSGLTSAYSKPRFLTITLANQLTEPLTQIEADKLSERFYRRYKHNPMHSGTGLGLSIVHAIVKAHNGKISITVKNGYELQVSIMLLICQ